MINIEFVVFNVNGCNECKLIFFFLVIWIFFVGLINWNNVMIFKYFIGVKLFIFLNFVFLIGCKKLIGILLVFIFFKVNVILIIFWLDFFIL